MTSGSEARRALLATTANPRPAQDYLIMLEAQAGAVKLLLRYVPDRLVLLPYGLGAYAEGHPPPPEGPLETWAMAVLDDLDDVLLARYLDVTAVLGGHRVLANLRQPRWDNPTLLARLG